MNIEIIQTEINQIRSYRKKLDYDSINVDIGIKQKQIIR